LDGHSALFVTLSHAHLRRILASEKTTRWDTGKNFSAIIDRDLPVWKDVVEKSGAKAE